MSEWLTTGEMIDRLKVGEVAEHKLNGLTYKVKKLKSGSIMCLDCNGKMTGHHLSLEGSILEQKWRILPKYVTFEEAMQALREGKNVEYLGLGGEFSHIVTPNEFETYGIGATTLKMSCLRHMLDGKWKIIE